MKFVTTVATLLLVLVSLTTAAPVDQERAVERHQAAHERAASQMSHLRERLANLAKAFQDGQGERIVKAYQAAERMLGQERMNGNLRERFANLAKAFQAGQAERIMKAYQAAERMLGQERYPAFSHPDFDAAFANAYYGQER